MISTVFLFALLGAAWAFPKGADELQFKRMYIDPLETIDDVLPRIVNGREAPAHSIPYQAYLIITGTDGSRWSCGGSLITRNYVLTAGHCAYESRSAEVYLGAHNLQVSESTRIVITSTNLRTHENYNEAQISNDVGLIQLSTPTPLNAYINVATLPSRTAGSYEGRNARVSGWGHITGDGPTSPVLREVNSTVISNSLCHSYYGIVLDSEVCISGSGGVGSCSGDSGGPLVVDNEQIGIVSYGVVGCLSGYPSAFTRISSFIDWIRQHSDL